MGEVEVDRANVAAILRAMAQAIEHGHAHPRLINMRQDNKGTTISVTVIGDWPEQLSLLPDQRVLEQKLER